ncbi:MAG: CvpA family protein [Reichenbachiella sp.]
MNTIDIVILVFLLIGAYSGYKKGLLMEIVTLAAFFIAIIAGIKLLDWGISILDNYIEGFDHVLPVIAFAVIFIGVIILLNYLGKSLKKILDMTLLGSLDDVGGAVIGVVKWALFISILIWIYESFAGEMIHESIETSYLYEPISKLGPTLLGIFSGLYPSFMEFFDQTKEQINNGNIST